MKNAILCLILFAGFFTPHVVEANGIRDTNVLLERIHPRSAKELSSAHYTLNPRKKIKKKRKTILNRKTKRGHGHHCPSF